MQTGLTVLLVLAAALSQALVGPLRLAGEMPLPLLTGIMLFYALNRPLPTALATAFLIGLLHDALGLIPLGYSSVLFCATTATVSRFRQYIMTESVMTGAVLGSATVVILQGITAVLLLRAGLLTLPDAGYALWKIAGSGLLALFSIPPLFWIAASAHRAFTTDNTRDHANGLT